jgi:hypothetical protein
VGIQNGTAPRRQFDNFFETKHALTASSNNYAPWYLPKEIEYLCSHKICSQMFVEALFIVAKTWKPLKCTSVSE